MEASLAVSKQPGKGRPNQGVKEEHRRARQGGRQAGRQAGRWVRDRQGSKQEERKQERLRAATAGLDARAATPERVAV